MFSNGNFSSYCPKSHLWTSTNNKGMRRSHQGEDLIFDISSIPCAIETCAITGARVMFRDDDVINIEYVEGGYYTVHKDGTKFFTNQENSMIVVEKEGMATVKFHLGPNPTTDNEMQTLFNYVSRFAYQHVLMETVCFDQTTITSFKQQRMLKSGDELINGCHLISRKDMTTIMINQAHHVSIIDSATRTMLNQLGQKQSIGKDYDYLDEMFSSNPDIDMDRSPGVFTYNAAEGSLICVDDEKTYYQVNTLGEAIVEFYQPEENFEMEIEETEENAT